MLLSITGYRSNNKYMADTIDRASRFYADTLLGKRMSKHLIVDIILINNLKGKEDAYGYCSISGDVKKPREFEIEIDSSKDHILEDLLVWLAHEFVHIKQFVRLELFDYVSGGVQWKSRSFSSTSINEETAPWEKEAYRLEHKLYLQFKNTEITL
jgi:hypothetical protein